MVILKFKVGDIIKAKDNNHKGKEGLGRVILDIQDDHYYAQYRWGYKNILHMPIYYVDRKFKLCYKQVKATKLAKRLYPNAEEKDGYLLIKEK